MGGTPIAEMVRMLLATGAPHDAIVQAVELMEKQVIEREQDRLAKARARIKRHREKRSVTLQAGDLPLEDDETLRNAGNVTPPDPPSVSPKPPSNTPLNPPVSSLRSETPEKNTRARGSRIDPDWKPSETDREFAASEGWDRPTIEREAARFRDFWLAKSGQNGVKLSWSSTWRNWIRNAKDRYGTGPPAHSTTQRNGSARGHGNGKSSVVEACDRLAEKWGLPPDYAERPDLWGLDKGQGGESEPDLLSFGGQDDHVGLPQERFRGR